MPPLSHLLHGRSPSFIFPLHTPRFLVPAAASGASGAGSSPPSASSPSQQPPSQLVDGSLAISTRSETLIDHPSTSKRLPRQVEQAVQGSHGLDVQFAGINFLESLVSEFSPSTSTAMGLPREFHEQCRISLEQDYMKAFYCWVQYAAFNVSDRIIGANSEIPEVKVCSAALRLMLQILNWDFRGKNSIENSKRGMDIFYDGMKQDSLRRSECILVQPGPAWRDVLISSGHVGWLLNFYSALRQKFSCEGYWLDCPLAVSARKVIVQFCSLTGTIFPSDSGNMQRQHLLQMLAGIVQWIEPPDTVSKAIKSGKSESELLDGCRALMSVATVTTPLVFDEG
ncbi:hypothetical protein Sango_0622900 [Sesamum angolense]|uniref:Uncharacterized protein n=1 Tax=Sesamum angolense TaxID=2727404 RepID=A0AAE1X6F1_9LAMI|nr:hypothetical protein Sango_0622900 [Sesamum angolense]